MRIIISPAKQMKIDTDSFVCTELPVFTDRAEILKDWIRSLSYEEQKTLWACNDKIARQNAERFAHMDLTKNLTPALLAYDGIQYTYMAPAVFEDGQYDYVQEHLRILSGFYGVVKPLDGVVPYRLEMQAKAAAGVHRNLYDFWGDRPLPGSHGRQPYPYQSGFKGIHKMHREVSPAGRPLHYLRIW